VGGSGKQNKRFVSSSRTNQAQGSDFHLEPFLCGDSMLPDSFDVSQLIQSQNGRHNNLSRHIYYQL
jgi:hypothetical protein